MSWLCETEKQQTAELVRLAGGEKHDYCLHEGNLMRWLIAYERDVAKAAEGLKRHLNIRAIMQLEKLADGEIEVDEQVEKYAPMTILGRNHPDDNKVVFFEPSGKIDIGGLVDNLQMTSFMLAKFRVMEKLHRKIVEEEKRIGRLGGAVLVMDLKGIEFSPKLLTLLTGPYRIMWGTLFDQYPQLIQQIVIVNAPSFVNVLYQACSPFLPNDYKSKIHISSSSASSFLPSLIHPSCLPEELGGYGRLTVSIDEECELVSPFYDPVRPIPKPHTEDVHLETVDVPAGGFTLQKYLWAKDTRLRFFLQSDNNFHYFIFHSKENTTRADAWREIYLGCERPATALIDTWLWTVPESGYYFVRYGNERAWLFSISVNFRITELVGEEEVVQRPIDTFNM